METIARNLRLVKESRLAQWLFFTLFFSLSGIVLGRMTTDPGKIRLLFFAVLLLGLIGLSLRKPVAMMYAVIWYLPFLGFFRRVLIPVSGWSSFDPLVVLAPMAILLLAANWLYKTYVRHQPVEDDTRLFKLVRIMLLIDGIQVVNPLQGGILAGFGGIMFYMVPLFWMVLSRLFINERWITLIYKTIFFIGVLGVLYGLKQMVFGFFPFEQMWIDIAGYAALMVSSDETRSFSFFTNGAEYTVYLVIAINIAWVAVLRGKPWQKVAGLLLLPLLLYGLFMVSSRTPVILSSFGIAVMTVVHAKKGLSRRLVCLTMMVMLVAAYAGITSIKSDNPLIAHQVNGLANPLDTEHSTLHLHWAMFASGMLEGLRMPIGHGLGSTTLAGAKLANTGDNSEVDVSNMMISNGIVGGIVYILIMLEALRQGLRHGHSHTLALLALGIMISTLGNWSHGGNYSTSAMIWLTIGYLDRITINRRRESNP